MPIAKREILHIPADCPGAELPEALDPWLWVCEVTPVQTWGGRYAKWLQVSGIVKMPDLADPPLAGDQEGMYARAREVRRVLYEQAEAAISYVEDAGYRHYQHPETDIAGEVRTDHYHQEPDLLIATARLRLWLTPR